MQKQRIVEADYVEDPIALPSAPNARPRLRLADDSDVSVVGPARRLQNDLARAVAAEAGWSVKRTVIVGFAFHAAILGSLALAASNLVPHIQH